MSLIRATQTVASCLLLLAGLSPSYAASTSCSASLSDQSFGAVDPFGGAVTTSATLNYSCTYSCSGLLDCLVGGLSRSEEHTSELQSLMRISYAVFCLKKKNLLIHLDTPIHST